MARFAFLFQLNDRSLRSIFDSHSSLKFSVAVLSACLPSIPVISLSVALFIAVTLSAYVCNLHDSSRATESSVADTSRGKKSEFLNRLKIAYSNSFRSSVHTANPTASSLSSRTPRSRSFSQQPSIREFTVPIRIRAPSASVFRKRIFRKCTVSHMRLHNSVV